jgi:glutamyl-tRNA reductase
MADALDELVALTASRANTSIDERERLLDALTHAARPRSFLFATCHRVELYAIGATPQVAGVTCVYRGRGAARHLFRVAAGLDSVIPGEAQVLTQLRAVRQSVSGEPLLIAMLERALHLGRAARVRTPLGSITRSLGSLAVDEALRHLRAPADSTALVIGAGEMGKLASRALRRRVRSLLIANRGERRALELARDLGAEAVAFAAFGGALARADVVISAADTRGALLDEERLRTRLLRGPLVVVDLAVPRSVAPSARALPGLVYRTADDLRDSAAPPADAIAMAERLCEEEAERFAAEWRERSVAPVIRALRERADALRQRQLTRALAKLSHLDERDREVVRALAIALTNSLLHRPTVTLRALPDRADAARSLFGLEERA